MRSVLPAAATLLAIIASITPASAEVLSNQTVPISGTVVNACNGESVAFTGEEHLLFRLTLSQDGGIHLGFHQNAHATGEGLTTGAKYSLNFTEGGSVTSSFPPPFAFTVVSHQNFLGQGKVPNFLLHETLSIAVAANGDMFATVVNMSATRSWTARSRSSSPPARRSSSLGSEPCRKLRSGGASWAAASWG